MRTPVEHRRTPQHGFALAGLMIAIAIMTLLAVLGANQIRQQLDDSAAEATGRYLLRLRGALINLQIKHEAWLHAIDVATAPPGTYPTPPPWSWQASDNAQVLRGTVQDLIDDRLLPDDMPRFTPLGEHARFVLVRQGTCPGADCQVQAFAYTCHPISRQASSRSAACSTPTGMRTQVAPALLGKVMFATDGYGGHDITPQQRVRGKLFEARRTWFAFSSQTGHAVVTASLDTTPFAQFLRQGDTRPVVLRNQLSVDGLIQTNTGLLFTQTVADGAPCQPEGMMGSTGITLAVCLNGQWAALSNHLVAGVIQNLSHDAYVPPPVCPAPTMPWRHVAITATDVTVSGGDLDVQGTTSGGLEGSGWVNVAGNVAISGSFSGAFQADPGSSVRVHQSVRLSADHRIVFHPPGQRARAAVIQGCRS